MSRATDAIQADDAESAARALEARLGPGVLYPISYAAPRELIVDRVPDKTEAVAGLMSKNKAGGYRFTAGQQDAYYDQYRRAYFAVTRKRGGWDCLRHIEIMLNGCLPLLENLDACPPWTMTHYPKALLRSIADRYQRLADDEASDAADAIDPSEYERDAWAILAHLRERQTTESIARDVLRWMGAADAKRVLFLTPVRKPNYACDLLFHGLRSLLGAGCVDIYKRWWMFDSLVRERYRGLYGNGFTYAGMLPDIDVDRSDVRGAVRRRAFDLVVYGCVEYGTPYLGTVRRYYDRNQVALIDGGDLDTLPGTPGRVRTRRSLAQRWACADARLFKHGVYFKREIADHTLNTAERLADAAGLLR
ncbi:MAG: hypothetical protein ACE37H_01365 [Phycisphaeraceae bacterium]